MLKKNQEIEGDILDWAKKGLGVLNYKGFPIYVPDVAIGDQVIIKVIKLHKDYGYGKLIRVLSESTHRIKSKCPVSVRCGGCQFHHMQYAAELDVKKMLIQRSFEQLGIKDLQMNLYPMADPYFYRNRAQYSVRQINGEVHIGLSVARQQTVIDIPTCYIQTPLSNRILDRIRSILNRGHLSIYGPGSEGVCGLMIRVNADQSEALLTLVSSVDQSNLDDLNDLKSIPELMGVEWSINDEPDWVNLGSRFRSIWGKDHILETIDELTVEVSSKSFFQVNIPQTEQLWQCIKAQLPSKKHSHIWDLYCGVGTFTMSLASDYEFVLGVESSEDMVQIARTNAENHQINHLEFKAGLVEDLLPQLNDEQTPDLIIVDPPRKGVDATVIHAIIQKRIPKLVYVSCMPDTLCRDLKVFLDSGYKVKQVDLVDLFPRTYHSELIVSLDLLEG